MRLPAERKHEGEQLAITGSQQGYVQFPRELMQSPAFTSPELWKVFSYCLFSASYTRHWFPVKTGRGETQIELLPGQFVFGRFAAGEKLNMPPETLRDRIERLRQMGLIDVKPATHYSIITVLNWANFSGRPEQVRHPTANQPPTSRHIQDSESSEKNEKKVLDPQAASQAAEHSFAIKRPRRRAASPKTGIDAINFDCISDFACPTELTTVIDLLVDNGVIPPDHYDSQRKVVLAGLMTARLAKTNPSGYFVGMWKNGFGKYGPSQKDEERAKQIMNEIGWGFE